VGSGAPPEPRIRALRDSGLGCGFTLTQSGTKTPTRAAPLLTLCSSLCQPNSPSGHGMETHKLSPPRHRPEMGARGHSMLINPHLRLALAACNATASWRPPYRRMAASCSRLGQLPHARGWSGGLQPSPGLTESQNVQGWKGPLWVTQPNPLPKQGHPEQAAQDRVQAGLEYLQRRRLHNLSGQPGPGIRHPKQ